MSGHTVCCERLRVPSPADPDSPYENLPNSANMRVSIRQTLRVGEQAGTPVEDLGVTPDQRYFMTKSDLLSGNEDLINSAAKTLSTMPVRKLTAVTNQSGSILTIEATSIGLSRLDMYIDSRPVESRDINDGTHSFEVDLPTDMPLSSNWLATTMMTLWRIEKLLSEGIISRQVCRWASLGVSNS